MLLPHYHSELLERLKQLGFEQWHSVGKSGFYAALGFGLLMHTFQRYVKIEEFMGNTWNPMILNIAEFDKRVRSSNPDAELDPTYWQSLNQECILLCRSLLPTATDLRAGGYSPDAAALYQSLADRLHLRLWVYGNEGYVSYRCESEGGPAVIVCLAVEAECVSVLIHKDFKLQETVMHAGFPYYELNEQVENSEERKLIDALSSLSNELSTLLLSSTQSLSPSLQPVCESLSSSFVQISSLLASRNLKIPLNMNAVEGVLRLQATEHRQVTQWRGHSVHQQCLQQWHQMCQPCVEVLLGEIAHSACAACASHVPTATIAHGCNLCLKCCAESWHLKTCCKCHAKLAPTEFDEIKRFYDSDPPDFAGY